AEDGIRDFHVTGVQTCALPILVSQKPANASSTALSTTSQTRWCRPRSPVEPMYMAGRLRTASRPSRTVSEPAVYCCWLAFDPAKIGRASCRERVEGRQRAGTDK